MPGRLEDILSFFMPRQMAVREGELFRRRHSENKAFSVVLALNTAVFVFAMLGFITGGTPHTKFIYSVMSLGAEAFIFVHLWFTIPYVAASVFSDYQSDIFRIMELSSKNTAMKVIAAKVMLRCADPFFAALSASVILLVTGFAVPGLMQFCLTVSAVCLSSCAAAAGLGALWGLQRESSAEVCANSWKKMLAVWIPVQAFMGGVSAQSVLLLVSVFCVVWLPRFRFFSRHACAAIAVCLTASAVFFTAPAPEKTGFLHNPVQGMTQDMKTLGLSAEIASIQSGEQPHKLTDPEIDEHHENNAFEAMIRLLALSAMNIGLGMILIPAAGFMMGKVDPHKPVLLF